MTPLRSIAFVINADKTGAQELARVLIAAARAKGVKYKQTIRFPIPKGYLHGCDACCVIGGDGTLLGVVRQSAVEDVPIIGVNRGTLGFLTTYSPEQARLEFDHILGGDFRLDYRCMLECTVPGFRPASRSTTC